MSEIKQKSRAVLTDENNHGTINYWGLFKQLKDQVGSIIELTNYHGEMAELNDALFVDQSDFSYYLDLANKQGGEILELGCGSGRITIPLAKKGFTVTGIDNAPDMLSILEDRISGLSDSEKQKIDFHKKNILEFEMDKKYQLIIFPYSSLLLFTKREERIAILRNAANHLDGGGQFAFDVPSYSFVEDEKVVELNLPLEGGTAAVTIGIKAIPTEKVMLENSLWEVEKENGEAYNALEYKRLSILTREELEEELMEAGLSVHDRITTLVDGDKELRHLYIAEKNQELDYPLWHPYLPHNEIEKNVLTLVEGDGCIVTDINGINYIDASGGLWSVQCGLGNEKIINAISEQLKTLSYATLFASRSNEVALELAKKLVEISPNLLDWVYLTGSGSESVELSIKLARQFYYLDGLKDKYRIVYLDQSYHGTFFGSMGVTGLYPDQDSAGPKLLGLESIGSPHPNNCPEGIDFETFALQCANELEVVAQKFPNQIAAFIFEPILGSAGTIIPPQTYFDRIKEICEIHDVLLIADEIATGFGRTGKWFSSEHFNLEPDIMLLSKGINSGYLPLGATLFSRKIGERLLKSKVGILHGSSHNGNPACCAAALATINEIKENNLVTRSELLGDFMREGFEKLKNNTHISEIRGKGLMVAVDFKQEDNKPASYIQVGTIYELLKRNGVLSYPTGSSISFLPALIISKEEINTVIERLDEVLKGVVLANDTVSFLTDESHIG